MATPPMINKVENRFLPLTESVSKSLEPEGKISDFEILHQIGEGSFGKVYLAKHTKTKAVYAIKAINKLNKNNQEGKPYFRREIEIMYKIHHPNVVKLYSHFEDDKNCYFVMEYVKKGNLFDQFTWKINHYFSVQEVAKYMKDLISAVYYLHHMSPPIIHRDIKPENVLIDEFGRAKLTDFGWSNYVNSEVRATYCGTPVYLAPEMIIESGHDEHLDIWCIGVLMFELLTGDVPFKGKDVQSLSNNILNLKILWPKDMNMQAKNLISRILRLDPKERISLVDMLKHPFFTNNLTDLDNCLVKPIIAKYNPFILSKDVPVIEKLNGPKEDEDQTDLGVDDKNDKGGKNGKTKALFNNLNNEYQKLIKAYNKVVESKNEQSKKLKEAESKIEELEREKNELLGKTNGEFKLKEDVLLKETVTKQEKEIMNLNLLLEKIADTDEKKTMKEYEMLLQKKDDEINDLKVRNMQLEERLSKNDNLTEHFASLDKSIKSINDSLVIPVENKVNQELEDHKSLLEDKIKATKELFEKEIANLKEELNKSKDEFNEMINSKNEEIEELKKSKEKDKEKFLNVLKKKNKEIEVLVLKKKKVEMMYMSLMKKYEAVTGVKTPMPQESTTSEEK